MTGFMATTRFSYVLYTSIFVSYLYEHPRIFFIRGFSYARNTGILVNMFQKDSKELIKLLNDETIFTYVYDYRLPFLT